MFLASPQDLRRIYGRIAEFAAANGVERLWLFHHKPGRTDVELMEIEAAARKVIEELDRKKTALDDVGRNARERDQLLERAAELYDFDIYGTVNFTDNFGVQAGYRSFDVFYRVDNDEGELRLKGPYFGGLVRF